MCNKITFMISMGVTVYIRDSSLCILPVFI